MVVKIARAVVTVALAWCHIATATAQQPPSPSASSHATRPVLQATRITEPPVIDGRLTEASWSTAQAADHFTQKDPDEGKPPTERTEIRVLYDDDALYVGARLYDSEPAAVSRRLTGRDEIPDADNINIFLDPRHDHRTGATFTVTAANAQFDSALSNDTFQDASWNAVWISAVSHDEQGWSAEIRIPFSQLRFTAAERQTWGMNVSRYIRRKNETVWLELVPKNDNGLVSRMMHLTGLDGIRPRRRIELAPYTAVRHELIEPGTGNPFNDGSRLFGSIGVDVKASMPGGLVLDGTINPDFGQAEVDPAVVNLSAYETFFQEKRRFFIEGAEIFDNFGRGGATLNFGFNTSDPLIFYSRRIGRPPSIGPEGDFVDGPHATTIVGAAKVTGKTANGWSVGLIDAVTSNERAWYVTGSLRGRTEIEPGTNYFVARLQRDFARGGAGLLTTSAVRNLGTTLIKEELASRAFVFGGDAFYFFDRNKDWVVNGKLSGSHIRGSTAAMAKLQRASQRYYQRPDATHVSFDPQRTSLSGYAGRLNLNRNGGVWRVNATLWGASPGFESNDLGFHGIGDRAGGHAVLLWRKQSPDRFTRSRDWWLARAWTWNFNRELQDNMWFGCANVLFLNYWQVTGCGAYFHRTQDDDLTRGGPKSASPQAQGINAGLNTDGRKWLSFDTHGGYDWNEHGGFESNNGVSMNLKPVASLTISTGPSLSRSKNLAQYIRTETDGSAVSTFGQRYVFATIDQTQLILATRVNWIVNPRASLHVFMQPLLATGKYGDFKELAAPRVFEFRRYAAAGSFISRDPVARSYRVDADAFGPSAPFSFDDPDFNLKSLRVNAIFRWEFRPGSTLYAVWTEQREDSSHPGDFHFRRDAARLFTAPSDDVFLVKLTYWIGR